MAKKYYAVPIIKTEQLVAVSGWFPATPIKLTWAEGMFGVVPVFTNRRKAEQYAGKELKHKIIVLEEVDK